MKRIAYLLGIMGLSLASVFAVTPALTTHAAQIPHVRAEHTGGCSEPSSTDFGYVSGKINAVTAGVKLVGRADTGPWIEAYLGCDTNTPQSTAAVASFALDPFGSIGGIQGTSTITKGVDSITITNKGHLGDITLFGGLFKATAVDLNIASTGTPTDASSVNKSSFGGIVVAGIPIFIAPPPNFGVNLPGLGKVIINEQTINNTADGTSLVFNALDIDILNSNSFGLPVGAHLIIGHAESKFSRSIPKQIACASGYAVSAFGQALATAQTGPWVTERAPETGGHIEASAAGATLPGIASIGAFRGAGDTQITPTLDGKVSGGAGGFTLLGGLIKADAIQGEAHAFVGPDGMPDATSSGSVGKITIAGNVFEATPGNNSRLEVPGVGHIIVNEQKVTKNATSAYVDHNLLDVNFDGPNKFGLPVGFHIVLGHFFACVAGVAGGTGNTTPVTQPTTAPTSVPTAVPTTAPTTVPTAAPTAAPTQTPPPCKTPRPAVVPNKHK